MSTNVTCMWTNGYDLILALFCARPLQGFQAAKKTRSGTNADSRREGS